MKKKLSVICSLVVFVVVLAVLGCINTVISEAPMSEKDPNEIRLETLSRLEQSDDYDTQSIVLSNTTKAEAESIAKRFNATVRTANNGKYAKLTLPEGIAVKDIYDNAENNDIMEIISPDYSAKISENDAEINHFHKKKKQSYTVNDSQFEQQSYFEYLNLGTTWNSYKGNNITVAIIDTGIDTDHSEFSGKISEYSYNASEDKVVKDYENDWSLIEDEQGHGTAVAGTVAASMDGKGTVGVAPNVTLLIIKAECTKDGVFLRTSDLVFGLYYAIERNVAVVNMSFGVYDPESPFRGATLLGYDSDILMVAAAGNDRTANLSYPAADEHVIGVGALEEDGWGLAEYSNYGENTSLVAPGTVYTTKIGGGYTTIEGTSFASPIVAAALALIKCNTAYKYAMNDKIEEILQASCYDLGDLGCDWYFGYGALDINALCMEEQGTVTFNMLTDELENTTQIFIRNHTLQNIPEPERLYAVFDGWYYDIQCTEEYNLYEDVFNTDLTLYANWVNEDDGVPYTYVILEDDTIEIRSYTGKRRYITIPDKIEGKLVTSIGNFAFQNQTMLRQVNLPSSLKNIGMYAFSGCSNIISLALPETVKTVKDYAFQDMVRLSTISMPSSGDLTSIGDFAWNGCGKLRKIDLPSKLSSINGTAFCGTLKLTEINVSKSNTKYCSKNGVLYSIAQTTLIAYPAGKAGTYTIPSGTNTIGTYAFAFTKLKSIDLNNVQYIESNAFMYASLESVALPDTLESLGNDAFHGDKSLESLSIGKGLQVISAGAFAETVNLASVQIPSQVLKIEEKAFCGSNVSTLMFEKDSNLLEIGKEAFSYCPVESIEFPDSLLKIADKAFFKNMFLTDVSFGENANIVSIGSSCFADDTLLSSVTLSQSLEEIGSYAFAGCGIEGSINLGKNVRKLEAGAFASCNSLTAICVDEENPYYADFDGVVYNKDNTVVVAYPTGNTATSYTVKTGTNVIGDAAFNGAKKLTSIGIPEGVTEIGEYAFCQCEKITAYSLPSTLTEIQEGAFAKNYVLTNIVLPDNVTHIGQYAFMWDDKLTTITLNETSKMNRIGFGAFGSCGITSFRVPGNVSSIAQYAFVGCDALTTITFAQNSKVEAITAYMFDGCTALTTLTFESGSKLKLLEAHALEGMTNLTTIDFGGAEIYKIGNFALRYCASLTSLTLPSTVVDIGRFAFYNCLSLTEVYLPLPLEHIGMYAFHGTNDCNIYFATETLPLYLDEYWDNGIAGYYTGVTEVITVGDYKVAKLNDGTRAIIEYNGTATTLDLTAVDFGGNITNIGGYAFANKGLIAVTLPSTIKQIQRYAFAYNKTLQSITIPQNVNYIANYAFVGTGIQSLTFAGNNVKVIEQYAFASTKNLQSVTIPSSLAKLGSFAFYNSGITSLSFASGCQLTEISKATFAGTKITNVTIPDSVTLINHQAFRDNMNLTSVTLGSGENLQIMANVFYNTGLTSVHIPANVEYIGEYTFVGLTQCTAYTVASGNKYYKAVDGVLFNKAGTKLIAFPGARNGSYLIPKTVETIGFGAFENTTLSSVEFEAGINLLTLGYRAFYNADGITSIDIPKSVVSIDYFAFAQCDNLETVEFATDNKLKGIYEGAFYGDKKLSSILLPDSIAEISDYAFYGCTSLTELPFSETSQVLGVFDYSFAHTGIVDLILPTTLLDIGNYAFEGLHITTVTVPSENQYDLLIGIGAFKDCNDLEEITLPFIGASFEDEDITWFGYIFGAGGYQANQTYIPTSLKKVTITDGITMVGYAAFYEVTSVEELSLPATVEIVYDQAFSWTTFRFELPNLQDVLKKNGQKITTLCTKTGSGGIYYYNQVLGKGIAGTLTLPEGVPVSDNAFRDCKYLTKVVLPDDCLSVGEYAFCNCTALETVELPFGLQGIKEGSFYSCTNLMNINIPDTLIGFSHYAFYSCARLQSIVIPSNLRGLGSNAFAGCSSLTGTLVIPSAITSIDSFVFSGCKSLTGIVLPDSLQMIGSHAFAGCNSVSTIDIPSQVTSIDSCAFENCGSLKSIEIPIGVKIINYSTFRNCKSLESITIPVNVYSIELDAFSGCSSLTDVKIPKGLKNIGNYAFMSCNSLINFTIDKDSQSTNAGSYNGVTEIGMQAFKNCAHLTQIEIPACITAIKDSAFYGCTDLKKVIFQEESQLSVIEQYAFYLCRSMEEFVFPIATPLVSIGKRAFYECNNLHSFVLPATVTSIGQSAFYECRLMYEITNLSNLDIKIFSSDYGSFSLYAKKLTDKEGKVTYKDGEYYYIDTQDGFHFMLEGEKYTLLAYLGEEEKITLPDDIDGHSYSLYHFQGGTEVTLPSSWTRFKGGFYSNNTMVTINIPAGVTEIGSSVLAYCNKLENVNVAEGSQLTTIDDAAFQGSSALTTITIPASVTTIGTFAFNACTNLTTVLFEEGSKLNALNGSFHGCPSLKNIVLPYGVTTIGVNAFRDCTSLTELVLPSSIKDIATWSFIGCSALTSIVLPDGLTSIKDNIFTDCSNLESISIPATVTSIGTPTFAGCTKLKTINLNGNTNYSYENGMLYKVSDGSIIYLNNDIIELVIPSGMGKIPASLCENNTQLKSVFIPASVTSIDQSAFKGCTNLTTVTFEKDGQLAYLNDYAFYGCASLESVVFPHGLWWTGQYIFRNCSRLKSVTTEGGPNENGVSLSTMAFYGCTKLETVDFAITATGYQSFYNCSKLQSITLHTDLESIYSQSFYGCSSMGNVEIPAKVTGIAQYAFYNCKNMTAVTFAEGSQLLKIDSLAFYDCSGIESFVIPTSVTTLGGGIFLGCSNLKSVQLPSTLTAISYEMFSRCSSLTSIDIPSGVISIGYEAFKGCSSLESITLPSGITEIPNKAFDGCKSLTSMVFPDGIIKIGKGAFNACSGLTHIEIPAGVTGLPDSESNTTGCFSNCEILSQITFAEGSQIVSIGANAFYGCGNLTSFEIPAGITSIGNYAFYNCVNLYQVSNRSDLLVTMGGTDNGYVGYYAKKMIDKEETVTYKNGEFTFIDTADGFRFGLENGKYTLYNYLGTEEEVLLPADINGQSYSIVENCVFGRKIVIPAEWTEISKKTFYRNSLLTSVRFESGSQMKTIGLEAFYYCTALVSIELPEGLKSIGESAFAGCSKLTDISIPSSVTNIGDYAFFCCFGITSIEIPAGVKFLTGNTYYKKGCFSRCTSLTTVTFAPGGILEMIGDYVFSGCTKLENIVLPSSVKNIYSNAFQDTAFYNNEENWEDGCLFSGNCLIAVKDTTKYMVSDREVQASALDAYDGCYSLISTFVGNYYGNNKNILSSITNIETLELTKSDKYYEYSIYYYFGNVPSSVPLTLKNVVIREGCEISTMAFLSGITGIRIFVEDSKDDCPWDYAFKGWNNGNKVYYKGEWAKAVYRDGNGEIISIDYYTSSEVVKPPYVADPTPGEERSIFVGWDINGDNIADSLPVTLLSDIDARAVFVTTTASYEVAFTDGKRMIYSYMSGYNQEVILPETPTKKGYTFVEWVGYTEGMTVSGDITFDSVWLHDGEGHNYAETVVPPTCEEKGYTLHTCSICEESYKTDILDAKGHAFGVWEEISAPSCITDGLKRRECTCGAYEEETIQTEGHMYVYTVKKTSTCYSYGVMEVECSVCHEKHTEQIDTVAHKYVKKKVPMTYLKWLIESVLNIFFGYEGNQGYYYECFVCRHICTAEESLTASVASTSAKCEHEIGEWSVYLEETCTEDGLKVRTCTKCSKNIEAERILCTHIEVMHEGKDPACLEAGWYAYCTCSRCDYTTYVEKDALGHDEVPHEAKDPTCLEVGWYAYCTCSRCDYTTYVEKSTLGHDEVPHEAKEPACVDVGWYAYCTCSRCDYTTYEEIEPLGHNYSLEWTVDKTETCAEEGSKSHHCTRCEDRSDITPIEKVEHQYRDWFKENSSTCVNEGNYRRNCKNCSYYETEAIEALGHNYSWEWTVDKKESCTEEGSKSRHCTRCGDRVDARPIKKAEHQYGEWYEENSATCLDKGNKRRDCKNCDYCETEAIEALGHNYSSEWTVDKEKTCTEEGSKSHHCTRCEEKIDITPIPAEGHIFGEWYEDKPATCMDKGNNRRDCENCDHYETEEIKALGHNYSSEWTVDKEESCTEKGSKSHHCTRCEEKKDNTPIEADPSAHKYAEWKVIRNATEIEVGEERRSCECCGVYESRAISNKPILFEKQIEQIDGKSDEAKYKAICEAVKFYNQMTKDEQTKSEENYNRLLTIVNSYNADVEIVNEEHKKETENVFLPFLQIFSGLLALIYIIKRRLF